MNRLHEDAVFIDFNPIPSSTPFAHKKMDMIEYSIKKINPFFHEGQKHDKIEKMNNKDESERAAGFMHKTTGRVRTCQDLGGRDP